MHRMRSIRHILWVAPLLLVLANAQPGCAKKQTNEAALVLNESFQKAEPAIKTEAAKAGTALRRQNYTEAVHILNALVDQGKVNPAQRKAIGQAIGHTLKIIDQHPHLDNPALYKAMSELIRKTHGEN